MIDYKDWTLQEKRQFEKEYEVFFKKHRDLILENNVETYLNAFERLEHKDFFYMFQIEENEVANYYEHIKVCEQLFNNGFKYFVLDPTSPIVEKIKTKIHSLNDMVVKNICYINKSSKAFAMFVDDMQYIYVCENYILDNDSASYKFICLGKLF